MNNDVPPEQRENDNSREPFDFSLGDDDEEEDDLWAIRESDEALAPGFPDELFYFEIFRYYLSSLLLTPLIHESLRGKRAC